MTHGNPITFFFYFPHMNLTHFVPVITPPPPPPSSPALRAQTGTKRRGRTGRERPALRHICALQPLRPHPPLHLPPLSILTGSQTTLHFCGGVSLASVQQGQMPFHFLAFDRCPALSSVSPSPRSLTGHHFPSLTAPNSPPTPLRFKGWDWQWLESEYIFTELIHQRLIGGHVR